MSAAYHVIIADDDATIRTLVTRVVTRTYGSVTISAVADGLAALGIYRQKGGDLVITNHDMPILDGFCLIEHLRTLSATLPIIMISGQASVEPRARAVGVTHFLLKPFPIAQLVEVLTTLLPP